jgi:hypothetical protein
VLVIAIPDPAPAAEREHLAGVWLGENETTPVNQGGGILIASESGEFFGRLAVPRPSCDQRRPPITLERGRRLKRRRTETVFTGAAPF